MTRLMVPAALFIVAHVMMIATLMGLAPTP